MTWLAAHTLQLAVLAAYLALMAWHGFEGKRLSRRLVDFYAGGRALGGAVIGLSFYATYFSTNSFVGHAGLSYNVGFSWLLLGVVVLSCALLSWHGMARRLRRFSEQLDSLTIPDFFGFRYQSRAARLLSALVIVGSSLQRDLRELLRPAASEQASLRGTRIAVLLYTALGAAVAFRPPGNIVELTAFSGSIYAACFLPPLLGGLYWRGGTRAATLATFLAGFFVVVGWKLLLGRVSWLPTAHEVFPGLLAGSLTFLLVSLRPRPPDSPLLQKLFPS